ncbi:hypothetical protein Thermo_01289 [Thermoplasmatales archaeon]|nr:hypothetical protein Thermo_01289 [Thermoplasmatales archaeon]
MIAKYYFRALISNKHLWFWGVFFSFIWAVLGAFIIDRSSLTATDAMGVTAAWFSIIVLISFSSIAVTIMMSLGWSANALVFSFKFSKLSRTRYLLDLIIAWISIAIFLAVFSILFTGAMFYLASGVNVFPGYTSFLETFLLDILVGTFFMLLAILLVSLVLAYSNVKSVTFLSFIPMLLVFVLSYQMIFGSVPELMVYISPWNSMPSLLFSLYTNTQPVNSFVSTSPITLNWVTLLISIILWLLVIFVLDVYIIKKIKPQDVEAMRQL